ncbi:aldo/keto reductase [Ancrocorticia populi]|uniref:aldo/keto reductase n=1 Tax=Ancrocorticia populi TaxID=2175228 RepID=UPI003F99D965
MQDVTLNNGISMPILGFGVFRIPDDETEAAVLSALEAGYRSIDTAAIYHNEEGVGRAIAKSGIPREELFVTTKLWVQPSAENTKHAFDASLKRLGLDYVDLYLIHQPFGDVFGEWRELEKIHQEGRARAIGVSNFYSGRLVDFLLHTDVPPAVNQIEAHPFFQRTKNQRVMERRGVQMESWGTLGQGKMGVLDNPTLVGIADAHRKTVAQVVLRWMIQRNIVSIPKSVHPERIAENIDVFDFELNDDQMQSIATLDKGESPFQDHYSVEAAERLGKPDDISSGLA